MTKEELRLKVEAELTLGKSPKELSEKYKVPYVTILNWKKKLEAKSKDADIAGVVNVEPEVLHLVAERLKEEAPDAVAKKIDAVVKGAIGLQQLEPKFHAVVLNLLERAEELSKDKELSVRDWKMLGEGIGQLYTSIFNKSGVNVNVMNNTQISGEKMQLFKGSMGK